MDPSGFCCSNCTNKFVPALRQSRNWVRAVPCGATVLGLRVRNALGSKSLSSHSNAAFHRGVLSVSQKPSRDSGIVPIVCSGGLGGVVEGRPSRMRCWTCVFVNDGIAWMCSNS
jgi:hypothetical protein